MADLTTLDRAKTWVGVASATTTDDTLLTRLISAASRAILAYLARPYIFKKSYTDTFNGVGGSGHSITEFPVLSVSSLTIGNSSVPEASSLTSNGFILSAWDGLCPGGHQLLQLRGWCFDPGVMNCSASFIAGYAILNEAHTIPATPYAITPDQPQGFWAVDEGVTLANGTALVKVSGVPTTGQYAVAATGVYTFAAADTTKGVLISYSFVPADLENACIEIVGELYRYKDRIGTVSKTLGGQETMTYSQKDIPAFVRLSLDPYRRVIT